MVAPNRVIRTSNAIFDSPNDIQLPSPPSTTQVLVKMSSEQGKNIPIPEKPITAESDGNHITKHDLLHCIACASRLVRNDLVELRCGDLWCRSCLERVFECAMKDETVYPPRCCVSTISLKSVRHHIPKRLFREYQAKQLELSTRDKTYCHKLRCSAFIAPHSIHNGQAICQKCRSKTCAKCRQEWHFGPCPEFGDVHDFMKFAESRRWKRCPECRRMVEREEGCNHMGCRCGCEFCYGCGARFYECRCEYSDDDNFEDDNFDDDEQLMTARRIRRHRHEDHQGYQVLSEKGTNFGCDICDRIYGNWISECEDCLLHVCNRCKGGQPVER